eukprot:380391-Amphidinium_carterae.1
MCAWTVVWEFLRRGLGNPGNTAWLEEDLQQRSWHLDRFRIRAGQVQVPCKRARACVALRAFARERAHGWVH